MKKSFKRYLSLVMVLMVAFVCLFGVSVSAAHGDEVKISFANKAQRTVFNTSQQVWVQNGITVTNDKGSSTSNVADYANPARFYKSSKLTISYTTTFNKIVFDCNSSSYASAMKSSIGTVTGVTVAISGDKVTCTFTTPTTEFIVKSLSGGQVRMDALSVFEYEQGGESQPSITVSGDNFAYLNKTTQLTCIVENSEETPVWSSADSAIATVDQSGKVTGLKIGKTKITATLNEAGVSQTIDFIVYPDNSQPISIVEAIEISKLAGTTYTTQKYTIEGTIKNVYNTQYGNMYITDGTNELCIYGLYSSDGKVRYDAMTVKPVAGDKIRVTGVLGQYNTTNQMKNGWLLEIVEDPIDAILEQLNAVESYMGLAYTYTPVEGAEETTYDSVFRIRCGIDFAIADIEGVESYGIKVATSDKEKEYDETSEFWAEDTESEEQCYYVVIDLGNLFAEDERFEIEFTVSAYVVVDGEIYYSEFEKTFSVAYLVAYYYESLKVEEVKPLYDLLLEMGKIE